MNNKVYEAIDDFYNHPDLSKVKDVEKYSVYMSRTYCLLSNECRYLIALVSKDTNPLGSTLPLRRIGWVSFQTRTLQEKHNVPECGYQPTYNGLLMAEIELEKSDDKTTTYRCRDLPVVVTLYNGKKAYSKRGCIINALETYQTIVTFR